MRSSTYARSVLATLLVDTKYKGEDGQKTRPFELPRDVREDLEATYNRTKAEHDAKQREAGPAPMVQEIDPADATPTELKPNAKNKVKAAKGATYTVPTT
eukprot:SAG31_NODE_556_length_14161_cov_3.384943_12_plen_100_part_00